jgi:hypothetical protein
MQSEHYSNKTVFLLRRLLLPPMRDRGIGSFQEQAISLRDNDEDSRTSLRGSVVTEAIY